MVWGFIKLWIAGKQGDKISTLLNAQLRDKMEVLDQHTHTGAPGDGSAELSGVDKVTLQNVGAPVAAGELKVNGTGLEWGAAGYVINNENAAIGVGSLRSTDGAANSAAPYTHTH